MKYIQPGLAGRMTLALLIAVIVACSWAGLLDSTANKQVDAGLKRALISFATARTINAAISVAQGTEVTFQPAGIGVVLAPGKLLHPISQLVETFSNLMLAATVAFGIEKVLIAIGAHWIISLSLTVVAASWAVPYIRGAEPPKLLSKLLIVLLMARFAIPIATTGSDILFQKFMASEYSSSQQSIDITSGKLNALNPPAPATSDNVGTLEKFKSWWTQNVNPTVRFENLKQASEQVVEHLIKLMAIFLLQTLLIPLVLLFALYSVAKGIVQSAHRPAS
jgi:hypothetical protein